MGRAGALPASRLALGACGAWRAPAASRARRLSRARVLLACTVLLAVLLVLLAGAGSARAQAGAAWWRLSARPAPSYVPETGEAKLVVAATNMGDQPTVGPVTITDVLPASMRATAVVAHAELEATSTFCTGPPSSAGAPSCAYEKPVAPFERVEIELTVKTSGARTGEVNTLMVSGGVGVDPPALVRPIRVSGEAVPFGVEKLELDAEEGPSETGVGGSPDTRAGSIPFQLTSTIDFDQKLETYPGFVSLQGRGAVASAPALPRDLSFVLAPGLLGDVNGAAQCTDSEFSTIFTGNYNACPSSSAIGVATVAITEPNNVGTGTRRVPVFNMVPAPGEPAQFGFEIERVQVILKTEVLTGQGYQIAVRTSETSELAQVLSAQVTLWGEPGDEAHDASRGWACLVPWRGAGACTTPASGERPTVPFLRLPTACEALSIAAEGVSWPTVAAPAGVPLKAPEALAGDEAPVDQLTGCGALPFSPSIEAIPEQQAASTPTGLAVDVHIPQQPSLALGGLAEGDVRSTSVALPEGILLSPAAADGLLACTEIEAGVGSPAASSCPEESKVGTVHIQSPFLPRETEAAGQPFEAIDGGVYLAAQEANPFGSLLAIYIIAESPVSHVRVKLAGEVHLDPNTGQIYTTFTNTPQLPFEDFKLSFFAGPRASLSSPPTCGPHTTTATFQSWSGASRPVSSTFTTSQGAEGAPCSQPQPLQPSLAAGSTNPQAGAYTPFTLTLTHRDQDQPLNGLTVHLPAGVAAMLASVTPCPEPHASTGECGPESLIGHASSSAGLGPDPYTLPGTVYLTGPYQGAPFGLAITTPANAGPFHLGNVIVRAQINVDPRTAAVTITSAIPTTVSTSTHPNTGIPVALKQTTVTIDRPDFEFNPTNCTPTTITAQATGAQGASAALSNPFQVTGCQNLPFHPTLTASAGGHASKQDGTSFTVKVQSQGLGVANIHKVDLTIPGQLPSRQSTLKKACTAAVFEANPATCSPESIIGTATIHTPVLKTPLSGPAYLVSHGNAGFPDVEFLLQGEGITVLLDGSTDIKKGVTYSRFETTPDAPFTTFETVLPAGPHGILTAYANSKEPYDLCAAKLTMPTEITAQNGAQIKQNTPVTITSCKGVASYKTTRARKLAKALKHCRKLYKHNHTKRTACERKARHTYGSHSRNTARRHPRHRARRAS
jgi:hypothetical protein